MRLPSLCLVYSLPVAQYCYCFFSIFYVCIHTIYIVLSLCNTYLMNFHCFSCSKLSFRSSSLQRNVAANLDGLLSYLKNHEAVKYVNVDSTMGKHCSVPNTLPADHVLMSGCGSRGKALVISQL